MKYIDADKLIVEINNRLMSVNLEELGNFGCHRVWAYNDVKDIISSLQQEQPEVELDEEITRFWKKEKESGQYIDTSFDTFVTLQHIAYHFANWQKEQMMKEAVEAYANTYEPQMGNMSYVEFVADIPSSKFGKCDKVKIIIVK